MISALAVTTWGIGSVVGVAVVRADLLARRRWGLPALLVAMAALQGLVGSAEGTVGLVLLVAFAAGLPIAACVTEFYRRLPEYAPKGRETEVFAWAVTALLVGDAAGAFCAGIFAISSTSYAALTACGFAIAVGVISAHNIKRGWRMTSGSVAA